MIWLEESFDFAHCDIVAATASSMASRTCLPSSTLTTMVSSESSYNTGYVRAVATLRYRVNDRFHSSEPLVSSVLMRFHATVLPMLDSTVRRIYSMKFVFCRCEYEPRYLYLLNTILDQHFALQWVQSYIRFAAFPSSVE